MESKVFDDEFTIYEVDGKYYKKTWKNKKYRFIPEEVIREKLEELEDTLDLCKSDEKVAKKEIYALEQQINILDELLEN